MIPPELQRQLQPYFPEGAPWGAITVRYQSLRGLAVYRPASVAPRAVMALTLPGAAQNLQTVGLTIDDDIYLDPAFGHLDTAAGMALFSCKRGFKPSLNHLFCLLSSHPVA